MALRTALRTALSTALSTALPSRLRSGGHGVFHGNYRVPFRFAVACAALASFLAAGALTQDLDSREKNGYEAQYDAEANPVRRAKLLSKFAPVEVTAAGDEIKNDQNDRALDRLRHLRDQVHETFDALNATGVDPVKHSSGFRELQIGIRESVLRLDDIVFALPVDDRPPFEEVRMNLSDVEKSLIDLLFPPQEKKHKGQDKSS